jgi:hypothetical protein
MGTADSRLKNRLGLSIIRLTVIGVMMALATACASQSGDHLLAQRASTGPACPAQSVRTCEVIGGNKFQKRYGRCVCSRQLYSPVGLN